MVTPKATDLIGVPSAPVLSRRTSTFAISCAAVLAVAGSVPSYTAAADPAPAVQSGLRAPIPNTDALLAQVTGLGDLGSVLSPVTDLVKEVLKADNGQLSPDEAAKLAQNVKDAVAKATTSVAATPANTSPRGTAPLAAAGTKLDNAADALAKAATSATPSGAKEEQAVKNLLHAFEVFETEGETEELARN